MTDDEILAGLAIHYPPPLSAAERTRQWREAKKLAGRPDTKTVDAAIGEASAFLARAACLYRPKEDTSPVLVDVAILTKVARIVLVRAGYNRKLSLACVVERLRPRPLHDPGTAMPSVALADDNAIQPPKGGEWKPEDIALIRELTAWKPLAPPLHPQTATEIRHSD